MAPFSPGGSSSSDGLTRGSVRELASGVDALYLSGWAELPDALLGRLERSKARAQALRGPVLFTFGGIAFGLAPYGKQKYEYWLSHEYGALGVSSKKSVPPLRWQPRSEFLHGLGVESALDALATATKAEVGPLRLAVSRLDLYSDWQGWEVGLIDEARFVRRARHVDVDIEGDEWTGFTFGRRRTGSIGGRIYDKTAELATGKGNPMWLDIWKERYVPGSPVIRVEFEFHRKALFKEFGLDTPGDVLGNLGGLWAHATEKWLTHRDLTGDATRSRLPISEPWHAVQSPSLRGTAIGLERSTGGKATGKLENILPILRGCFTSASAQWGVDGMVEGLNKFEDYLHAWELATGRSVDAEIALKKQRKEWGL